MKKLIIIIGLILIANIVTAQKMYNINRDVLKTIDLKMPTIKKTNPTPVIMYFVGGGTILAGYICDKITTDKNPQSSSMVGKNIMYAGTGIIVVGAIIHFTSKGGSKHRSYHR